MAVILFMSVFPVQGIAETRSFRISGYPEAPDDEYALFEAYCPDPSCDCQKAVLNVVGRHQGTRSLFSISFGFDSQRLDAGPYIDPLNRRCAYADVLLEVVEEHVLSDPAYVALLQSHYQQVKAAAVDPNDPGYAVIRRFLKEEDLAAPRPSKRPGGRRSKSRRKRKRRK